METHAEIGIVTGKMFVEKKNAEGGTRTPTSENPLPPQDSVSTSSTTSALCNVAHHSKFPAIVNKKVQNFLDYFPFFLIRVRLNITGKIWRLNASTEKLETDVL